jgi:enamine deaminase RidA (YjgF/YER057c/UK114 family)
VSRRTISSGSRFEELARYSRAVVDGDLVVVSGTIGADPVSGEMPESAEAQARNCFAIMEAALAEAGASLEDVIRCGVFLTAADHLQDVVRVLAEKFDRIRPANTTVICKLPVPGAKVEIEVLARRPDDGSSCGC